MDRAATPASQSFSVASPFWWWLTLGLPMVGIVALLVYYVPLRRTLLVYLVGYRYFLTTGDCPHQFDVVTQGKEIYRITYRSGAQPSPEHEVDVGPGWPEHDLDAGTREIMVAEETTARRLIDELTSSGPVSIDQLAGLESQAEAELARIVLEPRSISRAQTDSLERMRAKLRTYRASKASGATALALAGILEEVLREFPFLTAWLDQLRKGMTGQTVLVRARGEAFRSPWANLIGDNWSVGDKASIAGQVIVGWEPVVAQHGRTSVSPRSAALTP